MAKTFDHCLIKPSPGGPIPQNMAKTFDGPPTIKRSGSEHRRAVTSFLLRRKAWLEVELSLQERRRGRKVSTEGGYILSSLREERLGEKGGAFLKGKEGFCPPLTGEPKGV